MDFTVEAETPFVFTSLLRLYREILVSYELPFLAEVNLKVVIKQH